MSLEKLHDNNHNFRAQSLSDPRDYNSVAHRLVSLHRPSDSISFCWLIVRVSLHDRQNKWIRRP